MIKLNCLVICDECGVSSTATLPVSHAYSDGCYTVLRGDDPVLYGIKMIVDGTRAKCVDVKECAARKSLKEKT